MKTSSAPPPLERKRPPRRRDYAVVLAGVLLAALGLRLAMAWQVPLPGCGFRWMTGLPCPFCGSTRCLLAGFLWNPLTALVVTITFLGALLGLIRPGLPSRWLGLTRARLQPGRLFVLFTALAANWVYLLFNLPR
jgi:hypothetical protein